jgi:hypothetical protein
MPEADDPAAGVSSKALISADAEVSEKAKRAAEIGTHRYHSFFITSSLSLTVVVLRYFYSSITGIQYTERRDFPNPPGDTIEGTKEPNGTALKQSKTEVFGACIKIRTYASLILVGIFYG